MTHTFVGLVLAWGCVLGPTPAADTPAKDEVNEGIGELIAVDIKPGEKGEARRLKAKAGDLIQFRITAPAEGRKVLRLQVAVEGAAKKAAVVNTATIINGKTEPGSEAVSVFVVAEKPGQAHVKIVYVDNEGKPIPKAYTVEVVRK